MTATISGAGQLIRGLRAGLLATAAAVTSLGFTQVFITLDAGGSQSNVSVPTAQQGSGYVGTGSRVVYVSFSTGADTNTGTQASPVKTKAHALTLMRNGKPDQMLCLCGDTWPASDAITVPASGGGATPVGSVGGVVTGPWLFSFYGNGNRPLHQIDHTQSKVVGFASGSQSNIAWIGWEFYAPGRDSSASTYNFTDALATACAIDTAQNSAGDWLLVEDSRASYLGGGGDGAFEFHFAGSTTGTDGQGNKIYTGPAGRVWVRRCLIYNSYALGGGSNAGGANLAGGDAHAIFMDNVNLPVVDGCAVAYSGWDPILCASKPVTSSGSVLTWPIGSAGGYAFSTLMFGNGANIRVSATAGGLSASTQYYVINANVGGAGKFQLSTTVGGSAVTVTDGSYTMMWIDPTLTGLNHSLYLNLQCTTNNPVITDNLWLYSTNVMVRSGGTITGNYVGYHDSFGLYAGVQNSEGDPWITTCSALNMSGNVVQHPGNCIFGAMFANPGDGGIGCDLENVNGSTGQASVTANIFSMSTQVTAATTGILNLCNDGNSDVVQHLNATGNIFYKWNDSNGTIVNNTNTGTGNTTSPNVLDGVGSAPTNAEGYPFPLRDLVTFDADQLGGPGTVTHAIDQIIGTTPGGGRALQTWPTNLTPKGVVSYINAGFGK